MLHKNLRIEQSQRNWALIKFELKVEKPRAVIFSYKESSFIYPPWYIFKFCLLYLTFLWIRNFLHVSNNRFINNNWYFSSLKMGIPKSNRQKIRPHCDKKMTRGQPLCITNWDPIRSTWFHLFLFSFSKLSSLQYGVNDIDSIF